MLSRFIHTLSQFYQGLSPEFAPPTFKKHHFPTLSHSTVAVFSSLMYMHPPSPLNEVSSARSCKDLGHLMWRIDNHDLEQLRSALSAHVENKKLLSKHDCLVAYLVATLNCNQISPIQKVWIVTNVRSSIFPIMWSLALICFSTVTSVRPSSPRMWQVTWYWKSVYFISSSVEWFTNNAGLARFLPVSPLIWLGLRLPFAMHFQSTENHITYIIWWHWEAKSCLRGQILGNESWFHPVITGW